MMYCLYVRLITKTIPCTIHELAICTPITGHFHHLPKTAFQLTSFYTSDYHVLPDQLFKNVLRMKYILIF